ncbi:hypothetical protein BTVI_81675 [Pitangus sulphuratus]|nr:hypothetical protein BTVI_81675 [Pitangus sulphuratus]
MDPSPKDGESVAAAEPSRGAAPSSGVVVQVREKKGPLRAAIPYMPFPVAVICLFLNTFVPGLVLIEFKDATFSYVNMALMFDLRKPSIFSLDTMPLSSRMSSPKS